MAKCALDLHIHTVLSPCAEVEMIPPLIVNTAINAGLDLIAVADHNSVENAEAVIKAAQNTALKVLPGVECETLEGVHMLCIFDKIDEALGLQELIYSKLPNLPNKPETFGPQFVVDENGEFIRYNERLLLVPAELTIEELFEAADGVGGLVFPSHVDRPAYGILEVLGFLPEEPCFKAVEISSRITPEDAISRYPTLKGKTLLRSSDAHRLSDIGSGKTVLDLAHRTVEEIKKVIGK